MVAQGNIEGQSVNRPPLFDGEDYAYRKTRMEYFLQGFDYQIWSIVEEGDLLVTNEKAQWTDDDRKKISLNCKAKSILCCALSKKEFNRVSACKSAMEMWEKLRITYEGTYKAEEESSEASSDDSEGIEDSENEEAMLSRRLQRILAKKKKFQSGRRFFKKNKEFRKPEGNDLKKGEPICYECKKPGHIKAECPKLKKDGHKKKDNFRRFKKYKKKAMAASWENSSDSDSESSSSSDKEEANLAFMANTDDKI
ncbi:hypothetical protein Taro_006313 [Colocasia esculenta]|uniref:CCHC-type domain-containing protein n=1 Tax=Colocasia esculenta TaxID=4460 RepID=A0A843TX90_COLES|nr:hypothetical protein [Colocasia esculenta]